MRRLSTAVTALVGVLIPAAVYAQASLTGTVRDTSGAVLPGVTVEASSPALIEKVRSAVTDSTGQYRIVDLRPGPYSVTFTLTGFSIIKREGIELTGSFVATVDSEMRVGAIEETITVAGETPIVDIQSAKRQQVLSSDVLSSIPVARTYNSLLVLVPGVNGGQPDLLAGHCACTFSIHGGRASEGRVQVDGINVGVPQAGNGVTVYSVDPGNSQEVSFTTSGGLGEAETAGPLLNLVPRTGSNLNKGSFFASGGNSSMQGDNLTPSLIDAGLIAPAPLIKIWDVSGSFGGPLRKDRLWYFATARHQGTERYVTNMYYNRNAGNPNAWTYVPDLGRQAYFDRLWENGSLRLTWQISARNKINLFWDEQAICRNCTGANPQSFLPSSTTSPEAVGHGDSYPLRVQQASWTSTATNRVLVEFGFGTLLNRWGGREPEGNVGHDLVRVTEQCTAGCAANGNIPGLTYRSTNWASNWNGAHTWRGSVSYVTGAHSLKVGYQGSYLVSETKNFTNTTSLSYRVNNAVPNQLTMSGDPFQAVSHVTSTALYAQDQWTRGRLTLQGAIRFDRVGSTFPHQQVGPTKFIPVPLVFPEDSGVSYKDLTPRVAGSYNLFGNGKTAVKVAIGKYLEAAGIGGTYTATNPTSRIVTSVNRSWIDANRDFAPDCDLFNPVAQDLRTAGGDSCGAISNANFGQSVFSNTFDPAILAGWGVRPSDWSFSASVQQQVLPRVSMEVGYFRRWFSGFTVTDNLLVTAADYTTYSVVAPIDARLPGGGGYTISGLYDVSSAKFGQTDNFITTSNNFGNQYQRFNGVDVTFNVRVQQGLTFQGGTSTGQAVTDNCQIKAQLPEINNNPYCHTATGFLTQFRGLGSYTIPKVGVLVSATLQNVPGPSLQANYGVPNAVVAQSLGRSLSGGAANVTVNLVEPGAVFGNRTNELDLRIAKILRFGRTRTQIGVDVYNALNASTITSYNQQFIPGGAWLTPTQVLTARFARVSAQIDF